MVDEAFFITGLETFAVWVWTFKRSHFSNRSLTLFAESQAPGLAGQISVHLIFKQRPGPWLQRLLFDTVIVFKP